MTTGMTARLARLKSRQVDGLGLVVCLALAVAWYLVGYTPLSEARASRASLASELGVKRDEVSHLLQTLKAHEESLKRIRAELTAGGVVLQGADQLLQRVQALTAAAREAGLALDEIKPGDPAGGGGGKRFTTVPIHLTGSGGFKAFAMFLHDLRDRFADTAVTGFDLRGEPEMSEKPARFTFELVWFAAPAAPAAQTVPAAQAAQPAPGASK